MTDNFLDELNENQREAVEYCDGASLVIAGAGSGKTRVLTYKIAYLLSNGLKPWNILALTFTNKAAREMKQRIGNLVGTELSSQLWMGTFHSVFSRILRTEAEKLGYNSNFTIYDQSDSRSLVKSVIKELNLDDKVYKPASIAGKISMAKNSLLLPEAYATSRYAYEDDMKAKIPAMRDIYSAYCNHCKSSNVMDFDDLLVNTWLLFSKYPDVLQKYVDRFRFVLVDEYQDTNFAQHSIVLQLTEANQRVCVVGDDAQSIYSFRGANIDNILKFTKSYNDARIFKLERNYRSTQRIVEAANSLISHNREQIPKDVYSKNSEGDLLTVKNAYSDTEEAMIVCKDIMAIRRRENAQYSDFAILYRTNSQSRSFEEAMRKMNIPYRIYGGLSFYQRKEIKDILAYFRVVANPDDEEAFKRIINYPSRGIGDTTLNKIAAYAAQHELSLWNVISNVVAYGINVNGGTVSKINSFKQLMEGFISALSSSDAYELGKRIIKESGISAEIYSDMSPENLSRQENLEEFLGGMQDFVESRREEGNGDDVSMPDFLQEVSLLTDLDSDKDENTPKVTLMTIHSAKGLEFPTVFIVGVEENIFPSPMCLDSQRQLEEERRLLYVAITRAEKHCIITSAQNRYRFGKMEFDTPSRFLSDIDKSLTNEIASNGEQREDSSRSSRTSSYKERYRQPARTSVRQEIIPKVSLSSNFKKMSHVSRSAAVPTSTARVSPDVNGLHEGNIIEHERFGVGNILRVEGEGENRKATVQFKNTGTKQLLLKFARFKIIG